MSIEAMNKAFEVPLVEQLESVPLNARLVIESDDGFGTTFIPVGRMCHEAATTLRQAIEQADKQEPYAFEASMYSNDRMKIDPVTGNVGIGTPQTQQEQGESIGKDRIRELKDAEYCLLAILERAGEGATVGNVMGILEALSKQAQEPVAWESILGAVARGWCYEENANKTMDSDLAVAIAKEVQALYTTPQPQREWVGLTNQERSECWETIPELAMKKVEAKLKEKNGYDQPV